MIAVQDQAKIDTLVALMDRAEHTLATSLALPPGITDEPYPWRVRVIVKTVAYQMGLVPSDITGGVRTKRLFRARAAVCWLARRLTRSTLPQIGQFMGGRDHTTVINAVARAEQFRDRDPAFRLFTDRLLAEFQAMKKEH